MPYWGVIHDIDHDTVEAKAMLKIGMNFFLAYAGTRNFGTIMNTYWCLYQNTNLCHSITCKSIEMFGRKYQDAWLLKLISVLHIMWLNAVNCCNYEYVVHSVTVCLYSFINFFIVQTRFLLKMNLLFFTLFFKLYKNINLV